MIPRQRTKKLREKLSDALRRDKHDDALKIYGALERVEKGEPRWPHRKGDLLRKLKRSGEALEAYERAVDLYADQGFVARAAAMAKVILDIDPKRSDILKRVDPEEARRLHREQRPAFITADKEDPPTDDSEPRLVTQEVQALEPDSSAAADEVRFLDANLERATMEIDVSDLELREAISSDGNQREHRSAKDLAALPSVPLFAEVPQRVLARIVSESTLVEVGEGAPMIRAGTTADALFVLVEGTVAVQRPDDPRELILSEGDVVGVSCLLSDVTYPAHVTARTPVHALRISKMLLDRLVEIHPPVGDVLLEILSRRLIANFVRTSQLLAAFDEPTRVRVGRMFEVRQAPEHTLLFVHGKRGDGLYIPLLGELVAYNANQLPLGKLRLGQVLGQQSLMTRGPSQITVRAESEALVLRMPAARFYQLITEHPSIAPYLARVAKESFVGRLSLVPEED